MTWGYASRYSAKKLMYWFRQVVPRCVHSCYWTLFEYLLSLLVPLLSPLFSSLPLSPHSVFLLSSLSPTPLLSPRLRSCNYHMILVVHRNIHQVVGIRVLLFCYTTECSILEGGREEKRREEKRREEKRREGGE